jgi:putative oxidoreductase
MDTTAYRGPILILGRVLLAVVFLIFGVLKLMNPEAQGAYVASGGLPSWLVWPAGIFEIVGAVLIAIGWQTRIVALLFVAFTVLTALLYHTTGITDLSNGQLANFLKNLAIAGGFLFVFSEGPGPHSVDEREGRK